MSQASVRPQVRRGSRRVALGLSLYTAIAAAIVLLGGWVLGAAWLTFLLPGAPTMKANTATMQLLIALGLTLRIASGRRWARVGGPVLAGVAVLIAGLSLLQILARADLGIDQLLVQDTWSPYAQPGLMSTATSVCGLLAGTLVVLIGWPGRVTNVVRMAASWAVLLIVLVVLCIYLFDLSSLFSVAFFETMSLPTAIGFLCLVGGVVLGDPERGLGPSFLSDRAGALVVRGLLLPIVVVPIALGYVIYETVDNSAVALSIMTVGCITVLCVVAMLTAREVDRHDAWRRQALDQLRDALKRSEAASQAKSRFLANVSHDLRTPLNAIIGLSEAMSRGLFGEIENRRYRVYSADILRSGRSLLELINTLLDVAQIESQDQRLQESACDVAQLSGDILHELEVTLGDKTLSLENAVPAGLPALQADPMMLRRMISNLLDNSVKFTPSGGRVVIDGGLTPENTLWVRVSDTGPGMQMADAERLQEPFEQAQVSPVLARATAGIGLGLSIVRHFANLHGAALDLSNAETGGLQVRITFPPERTAPSAASVDTNSVA